MRLAMSIRWPTTPFVLLTDEKLRREMGRRARESAITRYSTDRIIPQYIEFYERILL